MVSHIIPAPTDGHPEIHSRRRKRTVLKKGDQPAKENDRIQSGNGGGQLKITVKADSNLTDKRPEKTVNRPSRSKKEQKITRSKRSTPSKQTASPPSVAKKDDTTAVTRPKYTRQDADTNDKVKHEESHPWTTLRPAPPIRGSYRRYTKDQMDLFFSLMEEQNLSVHKAAIAADVHPRTAYKWAQEARERSSKGLTPKLWKGSAKLRPEHGEFLDHFFESNPKATFKIAHEELIAQFEGLNISRDGICKYMRTRRQMQSGAYAD